MINTLLIVWGMHRSGTSLLSRAMRVFGAHHADTQLVIHSGNPTGYWEDRALVQLDSDMLDCLGLSWDSAESITPEHVAQLERKGYVAKALEFLRRQDAHLNALKDPRMTKLGPFWQKVFLQAGNVPLSVVAFRNPLSVLHSLQSRRGISHSTNLQEKRYCYELWLSYTRQALETTSAYPRACIEYDLFLQYPQEMLILLGNKLSLPIYNDEKQLFLQEILNVNHRHNLYSLGDLESDPECPEEVVALYTALLEKAAKLEAPSIF